MRSIKGDNPCADCGTKQNIVWFIESSFWNRIMGKEKGRILCINCFVKRAEKKTKYSSITGWELKPEWKDINNY